MKRNWKVSKTQRPEARSHNVARELRAEALESLAGVEALAGDKFACALAWAEAEKFAPEEGEGWAAEDLYHLALADAASCQGQVADILVQEARDVAGEFPGLIRDRDIADHFWNLSEAESCWDAASLYSAAYRAVSQPR
jgi:hypothetical protein